MANVNFQGITFSADQLMKPSVTLTGIAKEGGTKPLVDDDEVVQVFTNENLYCFTVELPCLGSELDNLACEIDRDGKVEVHGTINSDKIQTKASSTMVLNRQRRLYPSGSFTVSFALPGAVDPRLTRFKTHPQGTLEVLIAKYIL